MSTHPESRPIETSATAPIADAPRPSPPQADDGRAWPPPNRTALTARLVVDELARCGVRDACVSPGSRSAPLASALAAHGGLRLWSHVDERSGGFFALGLARASRRPVAIVCTSGSAVANLFPAVVEAFHARLPLVVLTADRPAELRDCGAGQTIDQLRIFGTHARWFFDLCPPEPNEAALRHVRAVACRAVAIARGDTAAPPGPVHLNLPFREPLEPRAVAGDVPPPLAAGAAAPGRECSAWTRSARARPMPDAASLDEMAGTLSRARQPLLVAGTLDAPDPAAPGAIAALCSALGAPLVAEVGSNLRRAATARFVVDAHDAVVRAPSFSAASPARPDAILRLGPLPTSKAAAAWLAALDDVPQLVVDPAATWPDAASLATSIVVGEAGRVCRELAARLATARGSAIARTGERRWLERWLAAGRVAREAIAGSLAAARPFEAHAVVGLARALPARSLLYVGNSLAVRALDLFWPADGPALRVLLNRGANGIDGFVSSVLGAAADDPAVPVVGLGGDLSFYHDLNGLLAARRHGIAATLVVLNNDGGGIFDHLPIASHPLGYETLFATPHGLDFRPAVEMYGCAFVRVTSERELTSAVARSIAARCTTVVELRIDRRASLAAWIAARERAVAAVQEAA